MKNGELQTEAYAEQFLATGSRAVLPEDTLTLEKHLHDNKVQNAVVIGAGFIGLEIFENLNKRGIHTQISEAKNSLMPVIDDDMSVWIEDYCIRKNLPYYLNELAEKIDENSVTVKYGKTYKADIVIVSA